LVITAASKGFSENGEIIRESLGFAGGKIAIIYLHAYSLLQLYNFCLKKSIGFLKNIDKLLIFLLI